MIVTTKVRRRPAAAIEPALATTNNVKGWIGVLVTEDSSFYWLTKR